MKTLQIVKKTVIAIALLAAATVQAGVKVVGVEIGASTVDQVRKVAAAAGKVQDLGTSSFTKGVILGVDNPDLGIDGVTNVIYVFDQAGKLAAIEMTMPASKSLQDIQKSRFDEIANMLASKYKQTKKVRPFVGDRFARFSAPDTVIELDAPHMSHDMNLRYMTPAFVQQMNNGVKAEAQEKRATEKSRL